MVFLGLLLVGVGIISALTIIVGIITVLGFWSSMAAIGGAVFATLCVMFGAAMLDSY